MTIRVVVVDDHALVRASFVRLLDSEPDLEVVGDAGEGSAALDVVARHRPDVVLMDIHMPGMDGIEATRRLVGSDATEPPRVVILTCLNPDDVLIDALVAGASGFVEKNGTEEQLFHDVRCVARDEVLISPTLTRRLVQALAANKSDKRRAPKAAGGLPALTGRERQVLDLVSQGRSNAEISDQLFIGRATLKTHLNRLFSKLGVHDRAQAIVVAHQAGLVGNEDG